MVPDDGLGRNGCDEMAMMSMRDNAAAARTQGRARRSFRFSLLDGRGSLVDGG